MDYVIGIVYSVMFLNDFQSQILRSLYAGVGALTNVLFGFDVLMECLQCCNASDTVQNYSVITVLEKL